jgi:hypothetical protein
LSYVTEIALSADGPFFPAVVSAYKRISIYNLQSSAPRVPLVANSAYYVRTAAVNAIGQGNYSAAAQVFTSADPTASSKVMHVRATGATGGTIAIVFTPPIDLGGENPANYVACLRSTTTLRNDTCHTVTPAAGYADSTTVFFELLADHEYQIAVAGFGAYAGVGAYSDGISAWSGGVCACECIVAPPLTCLLYHRCINTDESDELTICGIYGWRSVRVRGRPT